MAIEFNNDDFLKELDAELEAGLNLNSEQHQDPKAGGEKPKVTLEKVEPADKRLVEQGTMGEKPKSPTLTEKPDQKPEETLPEQTTSPKKPVGEEGSKTGGGNTVESHQRRVIIPQRFWCQTSPHEGEHIWPRSVQGHQMVSREWRECWW